MDDGLKDLLVEKLYETGWILNAAHKHWYHREGTKACTYFPGDRLAVMSGKFTLNDLRLLSGWIHYDQST